MADQLSGVAVIICIALGVLTFVLLFIFAKRQIMRFTLRSRRGPHAPIAQDAPKSLRQELERRLDNVDEINYEPVVLKPEQDFTKTREAVLLPHLYRMKAVDCLSSLENDILAKDPNKRRHKDQDVRVYLLKLTQGGPLTGCDTRLLHEFADLYEHSRHEPLEFTSEHFSRYMELLEYLRKRVSQKK